MYSLSATDDMLSLFVTRLFLIAFMKFFGREFRFELVSEVTFVSSWGVWNWRPILLLFFLAVLTLALCFLREIRDDIPLL